MSRTSSRPCGPPWRKPHPGAAYNLCDDDPAAPADVIAYAAQLLGLAPPPLIPFAEAKLSEMGRSFYDDNKRVRNDRIKRELGVGLAFPDYRAGLAAILEAEKSLKGFELVPSSRRRR